MLYFTKKSYTNIDELLNDFLFPHTKETFYDENLLEIQCKGYKSRSISDLLEIVQTYIPEATLEELLQSISNLRDYILKNITNGSKFDYPLLLMCPDIHKVTLGIWPAYRIIKVYPLFYNYNFGHSASPDEILDKKGVDGISLNQLKEILHESLQTEK